MVDECWVDEEKVGPQPGDFYGGWITSDIEGPFKGRRVHWSGSWFSPKRSKSSLAPCGWKFKSFSDTGKYVAAGDTARVPLVNRCT